MTFDVPHALWLLVPLLGLLWRFGRGRGRVGTGLRLGVVVLLTAVLAGPSLRLRRAGSDLVVVVDRSRSMPERADAAATELVQLIERQRGEGDRVGVVSFGAEARVERPLSATASFGGFTTAVNGEGSNVAAALDLAYDQVPAERSGRVLLVSDGRATGLDARAAARRLAARGVDVDYRRLARDDSSAGVDVAVAGLDVPPVVDAREPFLLAARVRSTRATEGTFTLSRNGQVLAKSRRAIAEGDSLVTFRELADQPGLLSYEVRVEVEHDGVPENDVGRGVVRVETAPKVLLVTDHRDGTWAKTLREAKLEVEVRSPGPLSLAQLDDVGAVVLEDVDASRLTESGLQVLAQYVSLAGGGLVMSGGHHSFGEGGYRKSPVEPLLPVSLEVREEQRKAALALSIIMDCSCSMGMQVPDGRTKMQLAAEGVVGALQLLDDRDEASVHMVDTEDHSIFDMSPVSEGLPLKKVASGFSGGGGIYVGVGLRAAKAEIFKSNKPTRHVLLFSDAADSVEPGDARATVESLVAQGVTVSVIGMGSARDKDAPLLRDIALWGKGRLYFAEDVMSLPRIFSQETVAITRSSFVDQKTDLTVAADWSLLGKGPTPTGVPSVNGYNLTYLRPTASLALKTADEHAAPTLAFWPHGAGRSVALAAEVDGPATGEWRSWPSSRALLESAVRWAMGAGAVADEGVVRARIEGNDAHVTLDVDPRAPPLKGTPTLVLLSSDAHQAPLEVPMQPEDDDRWGAHVVVPSSGTWHPVVRVKDRVQRAPPVSLSWAPEFAPAAASEGATWLAAVAKAGHGVERLSMTGLFLETPQSEGEVPLSTPLMVLAVVGLLAEVAWRRLGAAWPRRAEPAVVVNAAPVVAPRASAVTPAVPGEPTTPPGATEQRSSVDDALAEARRRARGRTGR